MLELYPGAVECVGCGHCCKVCSCGFAEYDHVIKQCKALIDKGDGTYECGSY